MTRLWNKWGNLESAPARTSRREKEEDVADEGADDHASVAPVCAQNPKPDKSLPARRITALSGKKIRVHLDCDGHPAKALFDPDTGSMEITVAPVLSVLGAIYPSPDLAAKAVISALRIGEDGPFDGFELWKIDDTSGRSLKEVRVTVEP
ncbi:hypothetical protein [Rhodococcus sp. NPDC003383]